MYRFHAVSSPRLSYTPPSLSNGFVVYGGSCSGPFFVGIPAARVDVQLDGREDRRERRRRGDRNGELDFRVGHDADLVVGHVRLREAPERAGLHVRRVEDEARLVREVLQAQSCRRALSRYAPAIRSTIVPGRRIPLKTAPLSIVFEASLRIGWISSSSRLLATPLS